MVLRVGVMENNSLSSPMRGQTDVNMEADNLK